MKLKVIKFVYRLIAVVMTSLVPGERWPLDSSPTGVPAADI